MYSIDLFYQNWLYLTMLPNEIGTVRRSAGAMRYGAGHRKVKNRGQEEEEMLDWKN